MKKKIAFCGLDCSGCEAFIATKADDLAAKKALLEKWRVEYNSPEMTLASITCDGCTSSGRLGGYCDACPIRACALGKGVVNCAYCGQYETCETIQLFIVDVPAAGKNLAEIRVAM